MEIKTQKQYILTLSDEEAKWLSDYLQNEMGTESLRDKVMRKKFWDALNPQEVST